MKKKQTAIDVLEELFLQDDLAADSRKAAGRKFYFRLRRDGGNDSLYDSSRVHLRGDCRSPGSKVEDGNFSLDNAGRDK